MEKPKSLKEIWPERALCELLGIPIGVKPTARSVKVGYWIKDGLPYIEKSGIRYFFEQDVIDFLWGQRAEKERKAAYKLGVENG